MSHPDVAAVVLAAGKGTRFKSDQAKVLHRAAGRSLLRHLLESLRPLELGQVVVVVGHQHGDVAAEAVAAGLPGVTTVVQEQQLGTAHAAEVALPAVAEGIARVMVVNGDHPLLQPATLDALVAAAPGGGAALLTGELDDPSGYGRVVRDGDHVARIVEDRDATAAQRAIREVNLGMYVFDRVALAAALERVDADNDQDERYLTDVAAILTDAGHRVTALQAPGAEASGVNDRAQLAEVTAVIRSQRLDQLMRDGVTVLDPAATYVDVDVVVGRDTVLLPGTILDGGTRVGSGATVGPNSHLTDTVVGDGAEVVSCIARGAWIGPGATVGPFTYLRPGARLERGAKAGAFVEIKGSTLGEGAKVPHLSYVGDAELGRAVNFSAGAVTVNYDGFDKHRTVVEDGAFVGCDTMLVAPVTVGRGAYVAAGSTVTDDVPADALAVARERQTVKDGWAARWRQAHEDRRASR